MLRVARTTSTPITTSTCLSSLYSTQPTTPPLWTSSKPLPASFWDSSANQRAYLDWLGYKQGFQEKSDYYHIRQAHYVAGGWGLVKRYGCVASQAVMRVYNEHKWLFWMFDQVPKETWKPIENQKKYMDWLGESLGYKTMDDWYKVKISDFKHNGWQILKDMYDNVPAKVLQAVYPGHPWQFWLFEPIPRGYWEDQKNHRLFVDWLGAELGYKKWEDWYSLQARDFSQRKASGVLARYNNSPFELITRIYPEHKWEPEEFGRFAHHIQRVQKRLTISQTTTADDIAYHRRKESYPKPFQDDLRAHVQTLFPGQDFFEEYIHMALFSREMVFDLYVPKLKLGFKYIPEVHYRRRRKNVLFHEACAQAGITLLDIPHWWDKRKQSLYGTIAKRNPSILPPLPECPPIPRDPPPESQTPISAESDADDGEAPLDSQPKQTSP